MTTTVTITNGKTHTGDCPITLQAALQLCVEQIVADPEWAVEVVLAAVLAQHELKRGIDPKRVMATLADGIDYREFL